MINFGDCVGHSLFIDGDLIFTFSNDELLIIETNNMNLSLRINVGQMIETIAIANSSIFLLTKENVFMKYSYDGKKVNEKKFSDHQLKFPTFNQESFICYDEQNLKIGRVTSRSFNILTEAEFQNIKDIEYNYLTQEVLVANDSALVYLKGKDDCSVRHFKNTILTNLKFNETCEFLAIGFADGTIKLLQQNGQVVFTDHWHAHQINCILFHGSSLYTAGQEGVIVQQHLGVTRRAFFPRQGGEIIALCANGDTLIANVAGLNQVKQISLMGQNELPYFQGIQSGHNNYHATYNGKIITQANNGYLQIINPLQGALISQIPIKPKNYISNIDPTYIRDRTIIKKFLFNDRFLICHLKSSIVNSLQIFENFNNLEFRPVATADYDFENFEVRNLNIVTWGNGEVRLWKQIKNIKGLFQWSCVFRGNGYKGKKILATQSFDNTLKIITSCSILVIDINNNQTISEVPLDHIDPDVVSIFDDLSVVCNNNVITFYGQIKKQISTTFRMATNIVQLNQQQIAINFDQEYSVIYNLKQQKLMYTIKATQIVSVIINNKTLIYSYQKDINKYFYITQLEGVRKQSAMVEEQDTAYFPTLKEPERPIIEDSLLVENNVFKRVQLSKQLRQIKDMNLQDYLIPQSHLLPSLSFLANRITQVFSSDLNESALPFQPNDLQLESQQEEAALQNIDSLKFQELKKLFKQ